MYLGASLVMMEIIKHNGNDIYDMENYINNNANKIGEFVNDSDEIDYIVNDSKRINRIEENSGNINYSCKVVIINC